MNRAMAGSARPRDATNSRWSSGDIWAMSISTWPARTTRPSPAPRAWRARSSGAGTAAWSSGTFRTSSRGFWVRKRYPTSVPQASGEIPSRRRKGVPASRAALRVPRSSASPVFAFSLASRSRRFSMRMRSARFISSSKPLASARGSGASPAAPVKPRTTWHRASTSRMARRVVSSRLWPWLPAEAAATSQKVISARVLFLGR